MSRSDRRSIGRKSSWIAHKKAECFSLLFPWVDCCIEFDWLRTSQHRNKDGAEKENETESAEAIALGASFLTSSKCLRRSRDRKDALVPCSWRGDRVFRPVLAPRRAGRPGPRPAGGGLLSAGNALGRLDLGRLHLVSVPGSPGVVRSRHYLVLAVAHSAQEAHYWPLTYTTFWLEHKIWGLEPAGYHVVNVLLHLLNSLLVWRLLLRLAVPGAWVAAAVFVVHPVHVESVAWIIERKDVLSGLFYLAAVLVWLRFLQQPRPWRYGLALLLFATGLLSKSIVVTLPAALLIMSSGGRRTASRRGICSAWRHSSWWRCSSRQSTSPQFSSMHSLLNYSLPERMLVASRALWFYAGKLAWPTDLAVIYPQWDISLGDPWAWLYLAGATALAATLWFMRHRVGRGPLAGALFFAVTLSPVLGFVNHGYMKYSFVADRFQYLAGIGVIAVLIGAAVHGASRLSGGLKLGDGGSNGGDAGAPRNDDLAPGGNLPERRHLLQPHRFSQPRGLATLTTI